MIQSITINKYAFYLFIVLLEPRVDGVRLDLLLNLHAVTNTNALAIGRDIVRQVLTESFVALLVDGLQRLFSAKLTALRHHRGHGTAHAELGQVEALCTDQHWEPTLLFEGCGTCDTCQPSRAEILNNTTYPWRQCWVWSEWRWRRARLCCCRAPSHSTRQWSPLRPTRTGIHLQSCSGNVSTWSRRYNAPQHSRDEVVLTGQLILLASRARVLFGLTHETNRLAHVVWEPFRSLIALIWRSISTFKQWCRATYFIVAIVFNVPNSNVGFVVVIDASKRNLIRTVNKGPRWLYKLLTVNLGMLGAVNSTTSPLIVGWISAIYDRCQFNA